jgi:PAS domain S-box-containing protein
MPTTANSKDSLSAPALRILPFALVLPFAVEGGRWALEQSSGLTAPPAFVAIANAAGFAALLWLGCRPRQEKSPPREENPNRLRQIFDDLPAAIYLCDDPGTITYCNDSAAETWGHAPIEGEPAEQLTSLYRLRNERGDRISYRQSCMAVGLAEKRTFRGEELILERPDGSFRTLLAYVSPFDGGAEFPPGTINVLVDVTKIKMMEKILRDANETLEMRVRERTRELEAAKDKAERSEQAKLRFLAAISHDLRTPLSGVLLAAQAMVAKGDLVPVERRQHLLQHIVDCVREQISFINDLLALVSYENAGQTNFRSDLLLNSILETCRKTIELQAEAKNIAIDFQKDDGKSPVCGDHHQLLHLFSNLLSNAVKFTPSGGSISLKITSRRSGSQVIVKDSGVGLTEEQINQFHNSLPVNQRSGTLDEPGTGLGLAIVRHVAELHSARIHITSEPQKGTSFSVDFPPPETISTNP